MLRSLVHVITACTDLSVMQCLVYAQLKDSNADLEQLHDLVEAEQQVRSVARI